MARSWSLGMDRHSAEIKIFSDSRVVRSKLSILVDTKKSKNIFRIFLHFILFYFLFFFDFLVFGFSFFFSFNFFSK